MHLVRVIECRGKDVGHHECPEKTMHICMRDNVSSSSVFISFDV